MATWEDGPEYAPVERPSGFATTDALPLELVDHEPQQAALAPKVRPTFDGPRAQVAPLAELLPVVNDLRDPARPFEVVSSTVTSMDSAWGSAHSSGPGSDSAGVPSPPAAFPPPTGSPAFPPPTGAPVFPAPTGSPALPVPTATPWPGPSTPVPPVGYPVQAPGGYPSPGTPQWFGPGPAGSSPPPPVGPVGLRAVWNAATPGLLIALLVGSVLSVFAPIMLVLALVLSTRVRVAAPVRRVCVVSLWFVGFFAFGGFALGRFWFTDWWDYLGHACRVICWLVLATVVALVHRALRVASRPSPPPPSSWR